MLLTARSQLIIELLPVLCAGIRPVRLRPCYADDALQQSLVALVPHMERLAQMPKRERSAYAFVVASRMAMAERRRLGIELARGSEDEVRAWEREVARRSATPEEVLRVAEGAEEVARAFGALSTRDRSVVLAINDDGLSEREAALKLGMTHGEVAYRLRRARGGLARVWLETSSWVRRKRPT
ncbi:sigma-70 family RNA polymerase sigma factor [Pendulispora albinea]|uniref:Sigma-70 family RNA polymerase sigma factor n=1 Tax=Pendulispora albinea TaxID=2741071 RepID=A0ABZ2M2S3_9BACT